jgi:hypothetical protein
MLFFRKAILTALISFWSLLLFGFSGNIDSLHYEILLSNKILTETNVNDNFINSFDITSNRLLLISTSNQNYLVGWGGLVPFGKKVTGNVNSFAFASDSSLLTIRNNELCCFDSSGNLSGLYMLPSEGMEISAGEHVMYVYGSNKNKSSLYIIAPGGNYTKLFEIPTIINSVVEYNNSILFATENKIFLFDPKNKELKLIVALPSSEIIKSIAFNASSQRIFYSTVNRIFAIKDSNSVLITDKFGGLIKFLNDGLIIFNPEKKFIVRITGLEGKIKLNPEELKNSQAEKPTAVLTNATIIDLIKSKLSDDIIINIINRSKTNFNLDVDSLIFLSSQSVSSKVIMAMKNAMKLKTSGDK